MAQPVPRFFSSKLGAITGSDFDQLQSRLRPRGTYLFLQNGPLDLPTFNFKQEELPDGVAFRVSCKHDVNTDTDSITVSVSPFIHGLYPDKNLKPNANENSSDKLSPITLGKIEDHFKLTLDFFLKVAPRIRHQNFIIELAPLLNIGTAVLDALFPKELDGGEIRLRVGQHTLGWAEYLPSMIDEIAGACLAAGARAEVLAKLTAAAISAGPEFVNNVNLEIFSLPRLNPPTSIGSNTIAAAGEHYRHRHPALEVEQDSYLRAVVSAFGGNLASPNEGFLLWCLLAPGGTFDAIIKANQAFLNPGARDAQAPLYVLSFKVTPYSSFSWDLSLREAETPGRYDNSGNEPGIGQFNARVFFIEIALDPRLVDELLGDTNPESDDLAKLRENLRRRLDGLVAPLKQTERAIAPSDPPSLLASCADCITGFISDLYYSSKLYLNLFKSNRFFQQFRWRTFRRCDQLLDVAFELHLERTPVGGLKPHSFTVLHPPGTRLKELYGELVSGLDKHHLAKIPLLATEILRCAQAFSPGSNWLEIQIVPDAFTQEPISCERITDNRTRVFVAESVLKPEYWSGGFHFAPQLEAALRHRFIRDGEFDIIFVSDQHGQEKKLRIPRLVRAATSAVVNSCIYQPQGRPNQAETIKDMADLLITIAGQIVQSAPIEDDTYQQAKIRIEDTLLRNLYWALQVASHSGCDFSRDFAEWLRSFTNQANMLQSPTATNQN